MFNWLKNKEETRTNAILKTTSATKRLSSYISDYEDEIKYVNGSAPSKNGITSVGNTDELLLRRDQIIQDNINAISELSEREINSMIPSINPVSRKSYIQKPSKDLEMNDLDDDDEDFEEDSEEDADISTFMKNLESDPYAKTDEILDRTIGKKIIEAKVVYDLDNTIQSAIYTFETKSYTSFYERWDLDIEQNGYYSGIDINGRRVNITPSKCYTVVLTEKKIVSEL